MDLVMVLAVYLLSRIIENWSIAAWQTRVLLLALLLVLVILGYFGAPVLWTPTGSRLR